MYDLRCATQLQPYLTHCSFPWREQAQAQQHRVARTLEEGKQPLSSLSHPSSAVDRWKNTQRQVDKHMETVLTHSVWTEE